jgi:sugar phosphate isomerase/epimerase
MKRLLGLSLLVLSLAVAAREASVFSKDNLVAWCIVPFDARERGPEERAAMLKSLGITKLAYDWRDKHIPTFDAELDALNKHGIRLQAFWIATGLEPANSKPLQTILNFLKRRKVKTELWYLLTPPPQFAALPQEDKLSQATAAVRFVAMEANKIGSKVGIYNHGGWFGEPENQLAILQRLGMSNVGMVYNFHHAHEQLDRFPAFFPQLVPHLYAVNINGMKAGGPKILTVGQGDREVELLKIIRDSKYRGPIGIVNHIETQDAEIGLRSNMEGLKSVLRQIGDTQALATY